MFLLLPPLTIVLGLAHPGLAAVPVDQDGVIGKSDDSAFAQDLPHGVFHGLTDDAEVEQRPQRGEHHLGSIQYPQLAPPERRNPLTRQNLTSSRARRHIRRD